LNIGAQFNASGAQINNDFGRPAAPGRRASSRLRCASSFEPIQERGAFAVRFESKLLWDNLKVEISNNREANKLVRPLFRKGWENKL